MRDIANISRRRTPTCRISRALFVTRERVNVLFIQIFPIIIYFSAVINILYYWGVMQKVVSGIAWLMQFTMETTAIESLNAACNIFVGMVRQCQ